MSLSLEFSYSSNISAFGIVSAEKIHKIAWVINKHLNSVLKRKENLRLEFNDNTWIDLLHFLDERELYNLRLIRNKVFEKNYTSRMHLLPEVKILDYLFLIEFNESTHEEFISLNQLQKIPGFQFVKKIDLETLKEKDNLVFY